MNGLKQLQELHAYYDAMLSGGYDGDEKEIWETLHAGLRDTKEQIKALKLNGGGGGNGKEAHEGNGGNGHGGNGKAPISGSRVTLVTDDMEEDPAIYSRESA